MDVWGVFLIALTFAVGSNGATYALSAVGLNVQFGYTGLLNFGHVASMGLGAYGVAIAVHQWHWSLWAGVALGFGLSIALSLLVGFTTLRLRADYLAVVTIAIAEMLRIVANAAPSKSVTNSAEGINLFNGTYRSLDPLSTGSYGWGRFSFTSTELWTMIVGWGLVASSSLLVWALMRSPWGRVLRAIREDEDAARALGKNVFAYKLQSLVLGGAIAALSGMLIALNDDYTDPTKWVAGFTFYVFTVVILGGPGRILGPIVGAMLFWFLLEFSEGLLNTVTSHHFAGLWGWLDPVLHHPIDAGTLAAVRFALVGLGLMLLMIFRPQGIFGDKAEMMLHD
ncbi:MAG TPA: branched-chain amino acid ABC transporter permease [Acidimicrobiales bacterium]|jgi:branched-chain amino acid transport system permease protein|nr:branched-chain amino acid ABC transporter permease [Acidimicrobiales bacterium]